MKKILFVCHGNICRSPMAEYLFRNMVDGKEYEVASCATSNEEIGNPVHPGTKRILNSLGIDCSKKRARRITSTDYDYYDLIIAMDENNIRNLIRMLGADKENKIHLLMEYANEKRDISDPWYTGDFNSTYQDVILGLNGLVNYLRQM